MEISSYLKSQGAFRVETRETVGSTNTVLREIAASGAPEGFVLAAEEQTAGKGRLGRSFYSPGGRGVYFSLLLRPDFAASDVKLITPAAAVAAAQGIDEVFGVRVGIKWVNDLLVNGKKVCGILTESALVAGSDVVEYAILGIGINVFAPAAGFPEDIRGVATALVGEGAVNGDKRCRLIAAVLDKFRHYYRKLPDREFLDEYRARSVVIGRDVDVLSANGSHRPARALAIDDECRLVVRFADSPADSVTDCGTVALDSGEISVGMHNA